MTVANFIAFLAENPIPNNAEIVVDDCNRPSCDGTDYIIGAELEQYEQVFFVVLKREKR